MLIAGEVSAPPNELPEESDQFRFLRPVCLANLKGSVGLITVDKIGHEDFFCLLEVAHDECFFLFLNNR